jgi:hypothetical protein
MQQLLCEPEDRIGSQAASSTTRPNSMIMQARRSGFINPHGGASSADGAELIKVWLVSPEQERILTTVCSHTLGSVASTGTISTDTLRPTSLSYATPPTRSTSTMTFQQR